MAALEFCPHGCADDVVDRESLEYAENKKSYVLHWFLQIDMHYWLTV